MARRDHEELKWLIAREIPHLRRYALALAGRADLADDLVQDCIERAIRKRHLWNARGPMRNWLYRLLHNVFINQKTERARARRQVPLESMPTVPSDPARQEDQVACQDIADVMRMLPHDQRAAIALTAVDGLSYDEAAEVLNVPIGTVRSRVARGRARMFDLYVQPRSSMRLRRVK